MYGTALAGLKAPVTHLLPRTLGVTAVPDGGTTLLAAGPSCGTTYQKKDEKHLNQFQSRVRCFPGLYTC